MDNRIIIDKGEYSSVISGDKEYKIVVSKGQKILVSLDLFDGKLTRNRSVEHNGVSISPEAMSILKRSLITLKESIDFYKFLEVDNAMTSVVN